MAMDVPSFRELYSRLNTSEDKEAYRYIMLPWQSQAEEALTVLRPYGSLEALTRPMNPLLFDVDDDDIENLYNLYALSRVSDMLLLPFQPDQQDGNWEGPSITLDERTEWFSSLGMTQIEERTFCPFYHEFVEVEESSDPTEPITLLETTWPGFMLDHLMICRAGVKVRDGALHIRKDLAETSTLCETYWRKNCPTNDDSMGWGSNSQWATTFRRDYVDATAYFYNVDGEFDLNDANSSQDDEMWPMLNAQGLTVPEMIEFVRNRCFILTDKDDSKGKLYPLPFRYVESR